MNQRTARVDSRQRNTTVLYVAMDGFDMSVRSYGLVAIGGVTGAVVRYGVSLVFVNEFPWATLSVNVAGAFLLGVVVYEGLFVGGLSRESRLLASTGFLSSFTTYSTFVADTAALDVRWAAVFVVANYGLGFLAVVFGREVVRWLQA